MGGPALQIGHYPQGLHQAFSPYCGLLASQEYVYVPVHRRHPPCSDLKGFSHSDSRRQRSSSSPARICYQPSKVFPYPVLGDDTPRCLDRHPQRLGQAVPGQSSRDQAGVCRPAGERFCVSRTSPEHRRPDGSLSHHSSAVSVSTRPLSSHLSRNFKWRSDSIKKIIPLDVLQVMEALQFWSDPSRVSEGVPSGLLAIRSDTNNRRLQLRLGSCRRRQPLLGKVDSSRLKVPHKRS